MRKGTRWAAWMVTLLALVGASLAWLATTEAALRWLVDRAVRASGGRLSVDALERTGLGAARAGRIGYAADDVTVEAADVALVVSVRSLFQRRPVVRSLRVGRLALALPETGGEPPQLPADLAAPIRFAIEDLRIGELRVQGDPGLTVADVALAADYDGARYRLALKRLDTAWASVAAELTLGAAAPFPLDGGARVVPKDERIGSVQAAFAGQLDAIGMGAAGTAHGAQVRAQAAIAPFAPTLAALSVEVRDLVLRTIDSGLPRARLGIGIEAIVTDDFAARGRVHVRNSEPGLLADERLPVVAASAGFRGSGTRWTFDDLLLDAGAAGRLVGTAAIEAGRISARVAAERLDLKALHPRLHATGLSGPVAVESEEGRTEVQATLAQPQMRIVLDARHADGLVTVRSAQWVTEAGAIKLSGEVHTSAPYGFRARGEVVGLDPARLGEFPPARLNGRFEGSGEAEPLAAAFDFVLADSRFRGEALGASGRVRVTPERVSDVAVKARLGSASASAEGALGASGDALAWTFDVPDLRILASEAAGRVAASGVLRGRFPEPGLELQVKGSGLRWGESLQAARLAARGELAEGWTGRLALAASADALRLGAASFDASRIEVEGTRAAHDVRIATASGAHRLEAQANGALEPGPSWRGALAALRIAGPVPTELEAPVALAASATEVSVGPARLQVGDGRFELSHLQWHADGAFASRGSARGLSLRAIAPLVPVPQELHALVLGGAWDVVIGDTLRIDVSLARESGDIVLAATPPIAAGLRELALRAQGEGGDIALRGTLDSAAFGAVRAEGALKAVRRGASWTLAADAPIALAADARMPSLAWAQRWLGDRVTVQGSLDARLDVSGTLSRPVYGGELKAADLLLALPDVGVALRDGRIEARLEEEALRLTALRFAAGDGEVTGTGTATLVPGKLGARLDLRAQKMTAVWRPDRLLVLSGESSVAWDAKQLSATGDLTVDRAVIELPPEDAPTPSRDVVVVDRPAPPERELPLTADIRIDLGKDFAVRGRGVDARLTGSVRAQLGPKGRPTLHGTVRAAGGTYTAFGQTLKIERGTITFAGPVDNPALDVLAVREKLDVQVGVAVGGTALLPQIRLVSTPAMSDADKLAYLTIGRPLNQAGGNEAAVLQAAAMALLSRRGTDPGTKGGLASRFGLDELSLGTATTTGERIVTLGKQLGSRFYLGFERGITGAISVLKITYDLSRRWSVQARAGTENSLDLLYTLGFR